MLELSSDKSKHAKRPVGNIDRENRAEDDDTVRIVVTLRPRTVVKILGLIVAILVTLSTAGHLFARALEPGTFKGFGEILKRFDLDWENNIPTLFSTLLILSCALLLFGISASRRHITDGRARHWFWLAVVFVYLAVDEATSLHELAIVPLRNRFDLPPVLHYAWVVPAFFCVVLLGLVYRRFVFELPKRTRRLFVCAAITYVGGALGMEMVCGTMIVAHGERSFAYLAAMTLEETLEMTGMVMFLYALLEFVHRDATSDTEELGQCA